MRHFDFLSDSERDRLFLHEPEPFDLCSDRSLLAVALGATLYSPATRPQLAGDIARRAVAGVVSVVVCLEDSIADQDLAAAEANAVSQLTAYSRSGADGPLIFVRVRTAAQIPMIISALGEHARVLSGFVLPKFTAATGVNYLDEVAKASASLGRPLLAMPVLESGDIIHAETRIPLLVQIRQLLQEYREHVLAVRVGATDLSAIYGLRRSRDLTVYDVRVVADVITDVVNIFGRADDTGYVVTGPVWEYFSGTERLFKPQLRESPFIEHAERALRTQIIAKDMDGLIREVVLDKANGLTGKTVIHPSHVAAVHALSVVTHEEYIDAGAILETYASGGVSASAYNNKMNESKPHTAWAHRIARRAQVFGVARENVSFVDLLGAGLQL